MVFVILIAPVIAVVAGTVLVVRKVEKRRQRKRALRGRVTLVDTNEPLYNYERTTVDPPAYSFSPDKA